MNPTRIAALIIFAMAAPSALGQCYRLPSGQVQCPNAGSTPPVYRAQPAPPPSVPVPRIYYPVQGGAVTQAYGKPWSENPAQRHTGVDIQASRNAPVYSTATGTVVSNGNLGYVNGKPQGGYTVIQNQVYPAQYNGYLHINPSVVPGQSVSPGQQIGTVYNDHLHFNQCPQAAGCQSGAFPNRTYPATSNASTSYGNYYQQPYQYR